MSSSKEKSKVKQNRFLEIWKQFRRNKGAMFGLVVLILLILIAVFADVIWDYDTDITAMQVGDRLLKPCLAHPFGTDNYGRDHAGAYRLRNQILPSHRIRVSIYGNHRRRTAGSAGRLYGRKI